MASLGEQMPCDCERLAAAIYAEIAKQTPRLADMEPDPDLHTVLVDAQLDLMKIASAIARRFCVISTEVETVSDSLPGTL